ESESESESAQSCCRPADAAEVDRYCAAEVAVALRVSHGAAADRVALADTLHRRHRATLAGMLTGDVPLPHARALAEAASPLTDDTAAELEGLLLPTARTGTPAQVAARGRRLAMRLDARAASRRCQAARDARRARAWGVADGMGVLQVSGPAATVAAAWARVDTLARTAQDDARRTLKDLQQQEAAAAAAAAADTNGAAGQLAEPAPDPATLDPAALVPTLDQLRADTVLRLLAGTHDLTQAPSPYAQVHIDVVVPATTLRGVTTDESGDEPGEVAGMGPIPAEEVRALTRTPGTRVRDRALGSCEHAAHDNRPGPCSAPGTQHDPGPYRVPEPLARTVRARDTTCRFPGCRAAARRCDTDHTIPHPTGPTAECNLACLCRFHHRVKHRGHWHLHQLGAGTLRWTSPHGLVATTRPPEHHLEPHADDHDADADPDADDHEPVPYCPLSLDGTPGDPTAPPPTPDTTPDDDPPWARRPPWTLTPTLTPTPTPTPTPPPPCPPPPDDAA
ncbi:HNH endonuclease signature motif containing protein, partial [Aquipuribacter sp. SD81]|uniref:HNH endonuclease signature motif containing protein n=1 Tax=Aquipuribacter sp. SD81 TaxID=3127703 RepID=UPI00301A97FE